MPTDEAVEKLRTLGVFPDSSENPNSVRENAGIFETSTTLDDVLEEVRRRHYPCGPEQFVYFHLLALLEQDPMYRSRFLEGAKQQLDKFGIRPEHIERYFQSGADPGLVFTIRYEGQYDVSTRLKFYKMANQFALDKMREWLEVNQRTP